MALTKTSHSMIKGSTISVVDYGAVGDNVTDDTAAIQAALNSGKATVLFPSGTYRITSQLVVPFPSPNLIGEMGATLDLTNISGSFPSLAGILFTSASYTTLPALSTAGAEGDMELVFASAPSVSAGDIISLTDSTAGSYLAPSYKQGEFVKVRNVSGNTVELESSLFGAYPTATTTLKKEPRQEFSMENLTIIGPPEASVSFLIVVQINDAQNLLIKNCTIKSTSQRTLTIAKSNDIVIDNCFIHENTATVSDNYGIVLSQVQNVDIINCTSFTRRHCIATGSAEYVNRHIRIQGGSFQSDNGVAVDCHGGTEYFTVKDAYIGGYTVGGNHVVIDGCTIINHRGGGTACSIREQRGTSFAMRNCFIRGYDMYDRSQTSAGLGFNNTSLDSNTILGGTFIIENNEFLVTDASGVPANPAPWINIVNGYTGASSSAADIEIRICNNKFRGKLQPVYIENLGTGGANFFSITYNGNDIENNAPDNHIQDVTNRYTTDGTVYALDSQVTAESGSVTIAASGSANIFSPSILNGRIELFGAIVNGNNAPDNHIYDVTNRYTTDGTVYALDSQVTAQSGSVTIPASGSANIFSPSILNGRIELFGAIVNGNNARVVVTIDGNMSLDSGATNIGSVMIPACVAHKSMQFTILNLNGSSSETFTYAIYRKGGS